MLLVRCVIASGMGMAAVIMTNLHDSHVEGGSWRF
jgi:hypothetical protein